MINVAIADDHAVFVEGLQHVLADYSSEISVAGTAPNGAGILQVLDTHTVDILILDISMPDTDVSELLPHIRKKYPEVAVLMLTTHGDAANIQRMLGLGATGYVSKNYGGREVVQAIKALAKGNTYYSKDVTETVMATLQLPKDASGDLVELIPKITPREREILWHITQDLTNKEIASRMFVEVKTVEAHKRNLFEKLGVNSSTGLAVFAVKNGYDKPPTGQG